MKPLEEYEGSYIQLSTWQVVKAERNTHLFAVYAFVAISLAYVDADYWDLILPLFLVFLFFWLLGMTIMVLRHRKKFVLTEAGQEAFQADELQAKVDLEVKNEKTRQIFNLWYVRYPIGICMFTIAWYLWEYPLVRIKSDLVSLIVPVGFFIYGSILTREISKFIIGIGLAYWLISESIDTIAQMPVSLAVVTGAFMIAYAIYTRR